MGYVELHCHSAYSFLDGASRPEELAARAAELGYETLALTDHDGIYGSLEFAHAARFFGVRAITGAEVTLRGRRARDAARRDPRRVREPLPAAHGGARGDTRAGREGAAAARPARPRAARRPQRRPRLPLRLRAPGARLLDPNGAARARAGLRPRALLRRAAAALRARDARRSALLRDLAEHLGVRTVATGNVHAHHPRGCRCRTCSSPSAPARRSTAASASGAATASRCSGRRRRCSSARPARSWSRRAQCRAR